MQVFRLGLITMYSFCLALMLSWVLLGCGSDKDKGSSEEARAAEILGEDKDDDGIRDDVEEYINDEYDKPAERAALRQMAKALQNALAAILKSDKFEDNEPIAQQGWRAMDCVAFVFRDKDVIKVRKTLRKEIHNTKARYKADISFSGSVSGATNKMIDDASACDFDPKTVK